jgi:L-alanine-DL-glutamate epimerase-like enolase superfamily enzyme
MRAAAQAQAGYDVSDGAPIGDVKARAYKIPTDAPEADGTLAWDSTTLVLVTVRAAGTTGLGWTYGNAAIVRLIETELAGAIQGRGATDVQACWAAMVRAIRNEGRPGLSSMAIAAVDVALWDLKAKLLGVPLTVLLGRHHPAVPIYGSGGFISYSDEQLADQLRGWAAQGIPRVKMKMGPDPERERVRIRVARDAIGDDVQLFVDANGAYRPKEAIDVARMMAEYRVSWFEEPVSSDDLAGLRQVREHTPPGMVVAAGEYGYDLSYFERMLATEAVDVLQADITRCGGITDLLRIDGLCRARSRPLSLHCSPALHANVGPSLETLVHMEYFHDHVRIEGLLFDGVPQPRDGALHPNETRPGLGVEFRWSDAERYAA